MFMLHEMKNRTSYFVKREKITIFKSRIFKDKNSEMKTSKIYNLWHHSMYDLS